MKLFFSFIMFVSLASCVSGLMLKADPFSPLLSFAFVWLSIYLKTFNAQFLLAQWQSMMLLMSGFKFKSWVSTLKQGLLY